MDTEKRPREEEEEEEEQEDWAPGPTEPSSPGPIPGSKVGPTERDYSKCSSCNRDLPSDGKVRKKRRPRKCNSCKNQNRVKQRREDVVSMFRHRLRNMLSRQCPNAPHTLYSNESITRIMDRWERKSVLDGTSTAGDLCIICYKKLGEGEVPTENDMIIVTSRQAQALAKLDADVRLSKIPDEVRARLTNRN
jgi:hypothetical protein